MPPKPYRYIQSTPPSLSVEERTALASLVASPKRARELRIQVGRARAVLIPKSLHAQILVLLGLAAEGKVVAIGGIRPTLTTQQVAERLGVSRPHVVSLIEAGQLAATKVGTHRRVSLPALEAYQARVAAQRSKALTALMRQSRHLGLAY